MDLVVGNSHKSELAHIIASNFNKVNYKRKSESIRPPSAEEKTFKSSIFKKSDLEKEGGLESGHTRLFLKIQDGCDSFCTFCIIPFARGKSRCISPVDLVKSVQKHYEQGGREVVLTGVHIGDYQIPSDTTKGIGRTCSYFIERNKNTPYKIVQSGTNRN